MATTRRTSTPAAAQPARKTAAKTAAKPTAAATKTAAKAAAKPTAAATKTAAKPVATKTAGKAVAKPTVAATKATQKTAPRPLKAAATAAESLPGVQEGDPAPDFSLPATGGRTVSLSSLKGKPFVLYFYPKADTPGCTTEACGFNEALTQFRELGLDVVGVSPDKLPALEKFAQKYALTFPLASDPENATAKAFGAWGEKVFMGRRSIGLIRSTFLVDKDGRIARAWRKVKVDGHAAEVLEAARQL